MAEVRSENYGVLCDPGDETAATCEMSVVLTGYELAVISLDQGAALEGKTLQETALRKEHGLNLVAVKRGEATLVNPDADFRLQPGDRAYIFGEHRVILAKRPLFQNLN
ncbi:MAG: TrkA C-terminal domain-containing protein [Desulfohalobiaceae bacterium]|nr:TrkA C-terminal domain-containing protein [Desulfohalobiaceae bacterium]